MISWGMVIDPFDSVGIAALLPSPNCSNTVSDSMSLKVAGTIDSTPSSLVINRSTVMIPASLMLSAFSMAATNCCGLNASHNSIKSNIFKCFNIKSKYIDIMSFTHHKNYQARKFEQSVISIGDLIAILAQYLASSL